MSYAEILGPILILSTLAFLYLIDTERKDKKKKYKLGKEQSRGLPMELIDLINYKIKEIGFDSCKQSFWVKAACGRYIFMELFRKDDPRFTATFCVDLEVPEKTNKFTNLPAVYKLNHKGEFIRQ